MPVRKITAQQFHTRRKDRRMVWVDAFAFLIGLLILAVSVGGIIVVEPEPEPFIWDYSFLEGKESYKHCMGSKLVAQVGCALIDYDPQRQGEEHQVEAPFEPIVRANVSQVLFTLTWIDDTPISDPSNPDPRVYPYDENATDILRLDVETPSGERFTGEAANVPGDPYTGEVKLTFNFTTAPEPGRLKAFTFEEANQSVIDRGFAVPDHGAIGKWRAWVTVVRAADQNGTLPTNACPEGVEIPSNPGGEATNCALFEEQEDFEGQTYNAGTTLGYESSYEDQGQTWVLDMTVRLWRHHVTF